MKTTPIILLLFSLAGAVCQLSAGMSASETRYDVNGDGRLDEEERQAMDRLKQPAAADKSDNDKRRSARSKPQAVTKEAIEEEIEQTRHDRFLEVDTDGDRVLSETEFHSIPAVAKQPEATAATIFSRLDQDQDRQVSLQEFMGELVKLKQKRTGPTTSAERTQSAKQVSPQAKPSAASDHAKTADRTK